MRRPIPAILACLACAHLSPIAAQVPTPPARPLDQRIEVRRDEAMFTMWAWITAVDTATDRSAWHPAKRHVRAQLERTLPPAYRDSLRSAYLALADHMFGYHATVLALHLEPPPAFDYSPELAAAYAAGQGNGKYYVYLRQLGEPILPLLREFHRRADIPSLLAGCASWYDPVLAELAGGTLGVVAQALAYLRMSESALDAAQRVVIIPNLVGPPGTAIGPTLAGVQYDVESPRGDQDRRSYSAHEYIHAMIRPFTRAPAHRARIEAVVAAVRDSITGSEAAKYYSDPVDYFDDSLVRAIDFSARLGPALDHDEARLRQALQYQQGRGWVLLDPLRDALAEFERSDTRFEDFFERLLATVENATSARPDTVPLYELALAIAPAEGTLDATATITFIVPDGSPRSVEYFLNAGLAVREAHSSHGAVSIRRDSTRRGEYRYAGTAEPLQLRFAVPPRPGDTVSVELRYGGRMLPDAWGTSRITAAWTELGLYGAWFPLQPERPFRYRLAARLPAGYDAAAASGVLRAGGRLEAVSLTPVKDVPLVVATGLQRDSVVLEGVRIDVHHTGLSAAELERIGADATDALRVFREWFARTATGPLQLVFAPRESGGGYARPGYVVLQHDRRLDVTGTAFVRYLAHEIAHLWWAGARTDTWEDWLNESFAEYAALRLLRARLPTAEWEALRARYREAAAQAPAIRGLDRDADVAFAALYRKGPLLLLALEERIGETAMLAWLRALQAGRSHETEAALAALERVASPQDRSWLQAALLGPEN